MPPEVPISPGSFEDDLSCLETPTEQQKTERNLQKKNHQEFSLDEVAKHSTHDDCWIIVRDKVYDVTSFVKRHPGGSLIYSGAGGDNTIQFESYHPAYVSKLLPKYFIGHVKVVDKPNSNNTLHFFNFTYNVYTKDKS